MANGTVKWFNPTKGFGFIQPEGGNRDVFLHISALERAGLQAPADGQKVTFDLEKGRDGRESAVNVRLACSGPSDASKGGGPAGPPFFIGAAGFLCAWAVIAARPIRQPRTPRTSWPPNARFPSSSPTPPAAT